MALTIKLQSFTFHALFFISPESVGLHAKSVISELLPY